MSAEQADHRKLPRRRGEELNRAIFEATIAELAASGYGNLTMGRVAARARTSKASLYRRWSNRVELVIDAIYATMPDDSDVPDSGDLREDLLVLLRGVAAQLNGPLGDALRGMLADALRDPELAEEVRNGSRGNSIRLMEAVAWRAVVRGDLDPRNLTRRALEVGPAMIRHAYLFHGGPIHDETVAEIVDDVVLPLWTRPRSG